MATNLKKEGKTWILQPKQLITASEEEEGDIYSEKSISTFTENDQITAAEEGFMIGYLDA